MREKIKARRALVKSVNESRKSGMRIVFTNGCFDIIHVGHVDYLSKARKMGSVLVVGLNSDDSVRRLKGSDRPLNNQYDRATVLSALSSVDLIAIFDEDTPEKLIKDVRPDVLVKGGDWDLKDIAGAGFVKSYGGKVATIPFVKGFSTTSLIEKISRKPV